MLLQYKVKLYLFWHFWHPHIKIVFESACETCPNCAVTAFFSPRYEVCLSSVSAGWLGLSLCPSINQSISWCLSVRQGEKGLFFQSKQCEFLQAWRILFLFLSTNGGFVGFSALKQSKSAVKESRHLCSSVITIIPALTSLYHFKTRLVFVK